MNLLSQITIQRPGDDPQIQLLLGDLTTIKKQHAADILVISAYPGSYIPVPNTLMAALYNKGVNVGELAKDKEINLLDQLGCWLSKPLTPLQQEQLNVKRILCFEPGSQTKEQENVVGNIFRCINTFAFDNQNNVIAMPLLASGNQKIPVEKMLPAILDAAIFWLESGLPLKCIKLALYNEAQIQQALPIFINKKQSYERNLTIKDHFAGVAESLNKEKIRKPEGNTDLKFANSEGIRVSAGTSETGLSQKPQPAITDGSVNTSENKPHAEKEVEYDFFISYAHTHESFVNSFVKNIQEQNTHLNIFYDKHSIPSGGIWLKYISDAIQKSKRVIVFLSPDYHNSPICWDEFQCAKIIEYKRKTQIIQTIYLNDYKEIEMPPIFGIYSWIDCRESDLDKLMESIPRLISW